tara:strand:- start:570 stop:878 length:309 start_codon:yes stop_codon:yes gene_type:complete
MKSNINKISFIKELCSLVVYETIYNKGFLRKSKTAKLKIWFTRTKVYLIEVLDNKGNIMIENNPFKYDFNINDNISTVFKWADENNYEATYVLNKGKGKHQK